MIQNYIQIILFYNLAMHCCIAVIFFSLK
jgi:hypothetical protein